MKKIVTLESLLAMLRSDRKKQIQVIGRALCALLERQIGDEQSSNQTKLHNGIGFQPADAYSGSMTAKYFRKHGTLLDWQIEKWMKPTSTGKPRIAKYVRQLNEIANEKAR